MNKILKMISLIIGVFIFTSCNGYGVEIGERAPNFTLKDTYGIEHKLSDFLGKYIVLEWFNPDCPFIIKHYDSGNMQKLQKKYTNQGIIWLSINSSAIGKQGHYSPEKFNDITKASNAYPTYVLPDEDGYVGRLYVAKTTPHIFVINKQGKLIYKGAIDSIASANAGDIPKSINYVDMVFSSINTGKTISPSSTKSYGCSVKY